VRVDASRVHGVVRRPAAALAGTRRAALDRSMAEVDRAGRGGARRGTA
jgi:hypothetical protein